jgi:hypothetical protein
VVAAYTADDRDTRGRGLTINPPDECMRKKIAMKLDSHLIVKCEVVGDTVKNGEGFWGKSPLQKLLYLKKGLKLREEL